MVPGVVARRACQIGTDHCSRARRTKQYVQREPESTRSIYGGAGRYVRDPCQSSSCVHVVGDRMKPGSLTLPSSLSPVPLVRFRRSSVFFAVRGGLFGGTKAKGLCPCRPALSQPGAGYSSVRATALALLSLQLYRYRPCSCTVHVTAVTSTSISCSIYSRP